MSSVAFHDSSSEIYTQSFSDNPPLHSTSLPLTTFTPLDLFLLNSLPLIKQVKPEPSPANLAWLPSSKKLKTYNFVSNILPIRRFLTSKGSTA